MKKIVVISAHPDDETLGCGGTLLKHQSLGDELHWIIFTSAKNIQPQSLEIESVSSRYKFVSLHQLKYRSAQLDTIPMSDMVQQLGRIFHKLQPEIVYAPFYGDVHSDHRVAFEVVASCSKWFRYPSIKKLLCYETLSETEFGLKQNENRFAPNMFIKVDDFLDKKIDIMKIYKNEIRDFPFPRSSKAIEALARLRGAQSGCHAAEAFMLIKEVSI